MKTNNNTAQPTQEFTIYKSYDGYPSKNRIEYRGTEQECIEQLSYWLQSSIRNGADVVSSGKYQYTCENYDNNHATVTFEVKEA
jgi:hypothetical protein